MSPALAKPALRAHIRDALRAASPDQRREWSAAIANTISTLSQFLNARSILFYQPMLAAGEVDITPLARSALAARKVVAFPRVDWANPAALMTCARTADLDRDFDPASRPPPNPRSGLPDVPVAELDLIIVPGLAFDAQGRRLGRGGGHYDRLLAHPQRRAVALAPAFTIQVVPEVPADPRDQAVDLVVTERSVVFPKP
ncbi:MAG: 5-formyltetrahydrofolate cyclo-ligase [Phycisphaerales bacterium]|nr:5-formyltetrahydrofolate cyclo-ligase [Phycisphaerales bacterium]